MSDGDAAVWNAWTTITPVVVAPAARARYVRVRLPVRVDPGPDGTYADLRVVDDQAGETPYAIDPARVAPSPARDVALSDTGFVAHRYSQAVLDLGAHHELDDAVTLEVDTARRPTYFERVSVEASDDLSTWRTIRRDAIVYRVADDNGRGNQTIAFPATRSRWLRIRVADPHAAFPVTGAHVERTERARAALEPLALGATERADAAAHRQVWTFDGRDVALRPAAVTFADGGATFARHAVVESSDDGVTWTQVADSDITRFAEGGAQTSFAFPETSARRWRVAVENGNDAPVPGLRPTLLVRPHDVVFEAAPRAHYRLLSGNALATAPTYDLGARLAHSEWRADAATAAAPAANASYAEEKPVTQRVPGVLTALLVVVAIVLGWLALQTVRTAKPE